MILGIIAVLFIIVAAIYLAEPTRGAQAFPLMPMSGSPHSVVVIFGHACKAAANVIKPSMCIAIKCPNG